MTHHRECCPLCGEDAVALTRDPLTVEFRDSSYSVTGFEYERCEACGEATFAAGQVDAMLSAAAALARTEQGLLTPEEIRALRRDLGLTQARLEGILHVGAKTVTRWEKGTVFQAHSVDTLMRLIWRDPSLIAEIESPLVACRAGVYESVELIDVTLPDPVTAPSRQESANNAYALAA